MILRELVAANVEQVGGNERDQDNVRMQIAMGRVVDEREKRTCKHRYEENAKSGDAQHAPTVIAVTQWAGRGSCDRTKTHRDRGALAQGVVRLRVKKRRARGVGLHEQIHGFRSLQGAANDCVGSPDPGDYCPLP